MERTWRKHPLKKPLDVIEFFSGKSRIARAAFWRGYTAHAVDIKFDEERAGKPSRRGHVKRSAMDVNGTAGYVFLGRMQNHNSDAKLKKKAMPWL